MEARACCTNHTEARTRRSFTRCALNSVFGSVPANSINFRRISAYMARRREQGAQPGTIHAEVAALRRMLRLAIQAEMLDALPPFPTRTRNRWNRQSASNRRTSRRCRTRSSPKPSSSGPAARATAPASLRFVRRANRRADRARAPSRRQHPPYGRRLICPDRPNRMGGRLEGGGGSRRGDPR